MCYLIGRSSNPIASICLGHLRADVRVCRWTDGPFLGGQAALAVARGNYLGAVAEEVRPWARGWGHIAVVATDTNLARAAQTCARTFVSAGQTTLGLLCPWRNRNDIDHDIVIGVPTQEGL